MAATFDMYFLCNKLLDTGLIEELLKDYEASIETVRGIDNWMWENERDIKSLDAVNEVLNHNGIIVIKLKNPIFIDVGIYIEKVDERYLYDFWINTQDHPLMDCDAVTVQNSHIFDKIHQLVIRMNEYEKNVIQLAGAGVESDFYNSKDIMCIIQNSYNMITWILSDDIATPELVSGYKKRKVDGLEMMVLEKVSS